MKMKKVLWLIAVGEVILTNAAAWVFDFFMHKDIAVEMPVKLLILIISVIAAAVLMILGNNIIEIKALQKENLRLRQRNDSLIKSNVSKKAKL